MKCIDPEKVAELERLYAQVPEVHCKGLCGDAYCGIIGMGETERLRLLQAAGHPPDSRMFPDVHSEQDMQALALLVAMEISHGSCNLKCPLLKQGKCSQYQARPMICRLWGATRAMECPHGCRPKEFVSDKKSSALLRAATAL